MKIEYDFSMNINFHITQKNYEKIINFNLVYLNSVLIAPIKKNFMRKESPHPYTKKLYLMLF